MFSNSGLYHTLNENIEVKITGFDNSCYEGQINRYGSCKITVEKKETAAAPAPNTAETVKAAPAAETLGPVSGDKLVKGQCYSNTNKYLGVYKDFIRGDNPIEPEYKYRFEKRDVDTNQVFTPVNCQTGGKRKSRRRKSNKRRKSRKHQRK